MVTITIELTDEQADAYAQHCKRIGFNECRALAINDDEAYLARDAIYNIREQLALAGYNPR